MEISKKTIYLEDNLTKETVKNLYTNFKERPDNINIQKIDLNLVQTIDSAGVAFLDIIKDTSHYQPVLINADQNLLDTIDTFSVKSEKIPEKKRRPGFFENFGDSFLNSTNSFVASLYLTADIFYWTLRDLFSSKHRREGSIIQQSILIGVNAVGIIGLLSFIIGLILAFQSSAQLRQIGANIYIADLIGISMVREMGPMMTAIIVAGRSGSAFASEIATMKISEELDALRTMSINPIRFLVVPKFIAITICMPLLVTLATFLGIIAGLLVAVYYLNLSAVSYINEMFNFLTIKDEIIGLSKSIFFAWVIVIIGVYFGFKVTGGAEGVGKVTTKSVVVAIFAVIVLDALFSLFYLI
ncbi:MAG: ABC transporter permease [Candidatus Marinimicrobia bacterium]|nr:ABC transporter permease [Candidatus Neomarinimicrobiota bacterium]